MDPLMLYDILYALATQGERAETLFGNCGGAARDAFSRSLTTNALPELWFEIPLAGNPWLDLHALTSYEDVAGTDAAFAGHDGAYADALTWFAAQKPGKVRQLALSYDTSAGDVEHPAVQLLVNSADPSVPCAFLKAAGHPELCSGYSRFVQAMPPEWYACYVGVFPGRGAANTEPWMRVECIVSDECQIAYANNAETLKEHLASIGMTQVSDDITCGVQTLARSPFPLELQFNVNEDGRALPALSASVRFQPYHWTDATHQRAIGALASWMQSRGLADGRCKLLAQTVFARQVKRNGEAVKIACFPAFVKMRWREGQPADAKAYLMARIDAVEGKRK